MAIVNTNLPKYVNDIVNFRRTKYTQKQFAKVLGVTPSRLCELERGKKTFSSKMLHKICDELGLEIRIVPFGD